MLGTTAQQHDMTDTKYKHTELGPIPQHWEIGRLANYFTERREKVSDKEFAPLSVTKNGVLPQLENVAKSNDSENRKGVRKGDFVINSRSDRKGSSGVSDRDGSVSLINIVLTPRKSINTAYCNYLLKSQNFIEEFYRYGRGIVADLWTTRYSEMKLMKLAIPPLDEQEAMVAYLDEQTGKIDAAIEREQFTKAQLESEGNPVLSYGQVHSKLNKSGTLNKELIKFIPNSLTAGKDNCLVYNGDFIFADTSEDFEGCGNNIYVDTEYPVYADLEMMYIVINNFMTNAIKYCEHKITISLKKYGNGIEYSITNDGAGIDKADLEKVWDALYNSGKDKSDNDENSGVGLSVVRSILDAHNAKCGCFSGFKGTRFWFLMDAYEEEK